jgi:hypothetical protein
VVGRFDFYNVMVINITQTRCKNAFFRLPMHVKKSDFYKNKKSHGSKKIILRSHFSKILKIENQKCTTQKVSFPYFLEIIKNGFGCSYM